MVPSGGPAYVRGMGDERRWRAVTAHDAGCDGEFVYAVRTTGVYCRPSCPSRRPRRENVAFFDRAADAEAAGFRACLRCNPRAAPTPSRAAAAVTEACRLIDAHAGSPSLAELARLVGLSPSYLQRSFKRLVGSTPRQYAAAARLERAKRGLRDGRAVTDSLYGAGYGSTRAFYEEGTGALGMRPAQYRRGGEAETIGYTAVTSPLGPLLVAATERGVCAVSFLDAGGADAEGRLRAEFPAAALERDDRGLRATAERVVAGVGGAGSPDLPLDVRASAFRLLVWRELRAIPLGQTRSYSEVARAIGRPSAARAVATACAANPVAVVVPCHRVVAADGSLAGYRWGVDRKRALLGAERATRDAASSG